MLQKFALTALSNRQFAELVGKSSRSITSWRRKGMPSPKADPAGAIRWVVEHAAGASFVDADSRKRFEAARAEKLELANARTRGELLPTADMRVIAAEAGAVFASGLSGLPGRLAGELSGISDPGHIRDRLRVETHRVRKATADRLALLGSLAK